MATAEKILRVGAVGAGRMGSVHILNLASARQIEVVAICTVVESEKNWIRLNVPNARIYEDYDEFISQPDIDAVWIASPTPLHVEHLSKALANGKHACTEKPLSSDKNVAWKMYELTLEYPHLKAIAGGTIGDVIAVRSSTSDNYNSNELDRIPGTAFAAGTREVYPEFAEWNDSDNAHGIVTLGDDLIFNLYSSRDNRHGHHTSTEVIGTKGRIMINGEPRYLNIDISTENGTTMFPASQHWDLFGDGFVGEVEAFRDWVLFDNQDHGFNVKDAAKAVSIASALQESFEKKMSVSINLVD
ncbi:hypothetical protein V1525DRAFT_415733 [Lipomyces kononenkoae]|uniref:Uncharacterized protein n=1 Tax=Lipomyces kononenkoae TaxID=34357 RepID=A0ACC3SPM4_LIPKO